MKHNFHKINIAIFTTKNSKEVVKLGLDYYKYIGIEKISIVCPKDHYKELNFNNNNVDYIFDEEIAYYDEIKESSKKFGIKSKWYLQQFLKLSLWNSSDTNLLIIDGDTIVSKETLNLIVSDDVLFYTKENIARYNLFINSVFNLSTTDKSFICNFCNFKDSNKFIFEKDFLKFLNLVEINIHNLKNTDLSEYQLHGTLEYINNKNTKKLRIFRRADLFIFGPLKNIADMDIHDLKSFFLGYNAICYEFNHNRNLIKSLLAHVYRIFKVTW